MTADELQPGKINEIVTDMQRQCGVIELIDRLHFAKLAQASDNLPCAWIAVKGSCRKGDDCRRCHPRNGSVATADAGILKRVKAACTAKVLKEIGDNTPFGKLA